MAGGPNERGVTETDAPKPKAKTSAKLSQSSTSQLDSEDMSVSDV